MKPGGSGGYATNTCPPGVCYLAVDSELAWGTSLQANDQVVLDLLDEHWLRPTPYGYRKWPAAQRADLERDVAGERAAAQSHRPAWAYRPGRGR